MREIKDQDVVWNGNAMSRFYGGFVLRNTTNFAKLYDAWHGAEPDQGHDLAAACGAQLAEWPASTQPAQP